MASLNTGTTAKRLIVLCDGTWQNSTSGETGSYPSNVTRFSRALSQIGDKDGQNVPQMIFYQPGVGTGDKVDKATGGVYGAGLSANVRAAYGFLAHNYNKGDQIYFFGWSRGAYTARAIAGLVTTLGLLTKKGMDRFPGVYQEYYYSINKKLNPGQAQPDMAKLGELADNELHPGADKSVEIIGVWDTVGFHGAGLGDEEFEFYNTALSPKVKYGFHALSLDETREAFWPTLWDSTIIPGPTSNAGTGTSSGTGPTVKQVWFCGTHAIGGGGSDSALADIALGWMIAECSKTKTLSFDDSYLLVGGPASSSPGTPWPTANYPPKAATGNGNGLLGFLTAIPSKLAGLPSQLKTAAEDTFWAATNFVLRRKSGVRTPNEGRLPPQGTNERIHESIGDRRLVAAAGDTSGRIWPCRPISGRARPATGTATPTPPQWALTAGGVLEETVPEAEELKFKGKIRPVA
ncbi:hypothetical protein A1O1_00725 [Capronia coronata CBS 617.96]|uniref:T6SS Phospholipase effector Tle1-like catalytic domain-containing protein n=1 Tax=Capronia coronata CBS 617.96 TaxID=1182541 RepID=W9YST5_9EURO|nr:uncharacterized protein A1O1_00725 [Capronia coronata CBS 617.96]EXJ95603.1 hypothetical protein A1O1_00725 [Capronia coronata CBS 617.96]